LWADALREASTAFTTRLGAAPPSALEGDALRKLYDSWIDCAEEAYAHTAHGDAFCNSLADFVNASSQWRRELQASIEHWSKLHDLPTRSEVNTLTRRLRAIEDKLDGLHAAPGEPRAAPAEGNAKVAAKRTAPPRTAHPRAARRKAKP
jgi:polyhydroxyalkanoate synthase subunit PhaE